MMQQRIINLISLARSYSSIGIRPITMLVILLLLSSCLLSGFILIHSTVMIPAHATQSTRGSRPDEVDLGGMNIWRKDSDVPAHNNLGFRVLTGATLIIYPGVTVEFDNGRQLLVEGTLNIIGNDTHPVNANHQWDYFRLRILSN